MNKKIDSLLKYKLYRINMINDIQKIKDDIKENERIDAIFRTSLSFLARKKIHIDLYSNPKITKLEVIQLYKKHYNIDAKKEFVTKYIFPSIKANALYQKKYCLATALARPLIANKVLEIAKKEKVDALAHGCSGKGNDQVRFDITMRAGSNLPIIAPIIIINMTKTALFLRIFSSYLYYPIEKTIFFYHQHCQVIAQHFFPDVASYLIHFHFDLLYRQYSQLIHLDSPHWKIFHQLSNT